MPRIRCFYDDCVFLSKGFCTKPSIELDPEEGCLSYSEDPGDLALQNLDDDEAVGYDESWDDAGFEEIEGTDFDNEDY